MKIVAISSILFGTTSALTCDHTNCADWSCHTTTGDNSWCKCYSAAQDATETDPVTGAPAFYKNNGCNEDSDPCDCEDDQCTPNDTSDTCGKNGGAICDTATFCNECDNAPAYARRSNGNCGACGNRHHGPCDVNSATPGCTVGGVCAYHTCFVATSADVSLNKQEPAVTADKSWVGLCEVCGKNGSPVCSSDPTSHKYSALGKCTPGHGWARRSNGNCGECGNRHHGPCDVNSATPGCTVGPVCANHTCFVATSADVSLNNQEPVVTADKSWVGLCEVCGKNGGQICSSDPNSHKYSALGKCTPGRGWARRSNGNCGECGKRFHEPCDATTGGTPGCSACEMQFPGATCSVLTSTTVSASKQEPAKTPETTYVGLCELDQYHL